MSDNQPVEAGTLVAEVDDRSLRIGVDNAEAQIAGAEANLDSLRAQIIRQQSAIEQARAVVAASEANVKFAEIDRDRTANLAAAGSVRSREEAQAQWDTQRAALQRDTAGLHSAEQQTGILNADLESGRSDLLKAQAGKASAELNLSYARLSAPVSGVVAQLRARVGGFASIGDPSLTLVPLDALYVDATFAKRNWRGSLLASPSS
ncbi:HlyD family secretion protein [Rhizobium sp. P28RR-XV]|uniref:HlyD family secretion protein n=1 Tax=Rhizobium sp. P28RR-XV TaxID=2726737 RepID=UPI003917E3EA